MFGHLLMSTPAALLPPNEAERLATLRHYNILTAPPEGVFLSLTAFAAHLFAVPLSFVALVDEHEVCFPVAHGMERMRSMPRAQALCATAILHTHPVVYENLSAAPQAGPDGEAIRSALALGNGFYAAAPLRMPDGHSIGVLCLASPAPRQLSAAEQDTLSDIADLTALVIAVRHLCLATPELGADEWRVASGQLQQALAALRIQSNESRSQHELQTQVPETVLQAVRKGLLALRITLAE